MLRLLGATVMFVYETITIMNMSHYTGEKPYKCHIYRLHVLYHYRRLMNVARAQKISFALLHLPAFYSQPHACDGESC